jgi:hypothetical protein
VSDDRAHRSHRAHSNGHLFTCYYCEKVGNIFSTNSESEYKKHGGNKHTKNPLLYPSKAEIEHYGLKPQGKEWEI